MGRLMKHHFLSVRAVLAGLVVGLAVPVAHADEAMLAAGAGFRRPIAELATAYEAQSGRKILQTYDILAR